jgi:hypothetical protein
MASLKHALALLTCCVCSEPLQRVMLAVQSKRNCDRNNIKYMQHPCTISPQQRSFRHICMQASKRRLLRAAQQCAVCANKTSTEPAYQEWAAHQM